MKVADRVDGADVPVDVLDEVLGAAVGAGAAPSLQGLHQGQHLGRPVHRGRAGEDQVVHTARLHRLQHR